MAKEFARRVSKRDRKVLDLSEKVGQDLFRWGDERLLKGLELSEINLADIDIKEQVRTKFNDSSIRDLADNIKVNGLIQPLVVHRKNQRYTLICGERRFRAMQVIEKKEAPCFILDGKTEQELMAIQFSENSAREELHYVDKADGILNYQLATAASERKIQKALGISKSEVHRSLQIARLSLALKEAAKNFNIEKYVLLELDSLDPDSQLKRQLTQLVIDGEITKRAGLKKFIKSFSNVPKQRTALLDDRSTPIVQ